MGEEAAITKREQRGINAAQGQIEDRDLARRMVTPL